MDRLKEVTATAKKTIYVQTMTFEGDAAGQELIETLLDASAKDIRLVIDSYSKVVTNDHFVYGPEYLMSQDFRDEVRNTRTLLEHAQSNGIKVTYTNPTGPFLFRYPCRNHKKIVVVDEEISFIGGINYSDHNFEWHDFMIEIQDSAIGVAMSDDVRNTCRMRNQSCVHTFQDSELYFFNGRRSQSLYDDFFEIFRRAKTEITILSPYVSDPLLGYLRNNISKTVRLSIVSPAQNNKSILKHYLNSERSKKYFDLYEYQDGMFHGKAIVIDGETLIVGSSNFDFVSYYLEQEVVMVMTRPAVVAAFMEKILTPYQLRSRLVSNANANIGYSYLVKMIHLFCRVSSKSIWRLS